VSGAYIIHDRAGSIRYMSKLELQQAVDEATLNGTGRRFMPYEHKTPPAAEKKEQVK
jgi:hypothetical protein